jgi:GT2 family glycosyltransferase
MPDGTNLSNFDGCQAAPCATASASPAGGRVVVAIPARNELDRIGACLAALAQQQGAKPDKIVLFLNGCTDGTAAHVRGLAPTLGVDLRIIERDLPAHLANAGCARSLAVRRAAAGLADHDVLMTTDADGRVAPDWIESNLAALRDGADAVCGQAVIDPLEALLIPAHLHEDDRLECRLATLLDEMAMLIDPDPDDPWPRHCEHSGASLAFTVAAWRRAGGIPAVATGEDRAFVARLREADARIRHAPFVRVTVSGRTQGRAAGGMADTIRRRMVQQDQYTDDAIEPAADRFRRLTLRAHARGIWLGAHTDLMPLVQAMALSSSELRQALDQPFFGRAWAQLEQASPMLRPRRVAFTELTGEIETAMQLCDRARAARPRAYLSRAARLVAA